jgi:aspartyl-tRNA(Asn)/glutamyl-tRNA(Gln) amidotransferase subunit B
MPSSGIHAQPQDFQAVIGLEVHAELQTRSKMFCACPVIDPILAPPNSAVCPVCAGMPGALPVANQQAVDFALRVALALECQVLPSSIFARKNYFYPDLPKGYQISQYEQPLAVRGRLIIPTSRGDRSIRVRRVHLEEDTGKLTHLGAGEQAHSLVDLNRAGVPLLEIVSEPDLHSAEEVRAYASALRSLLLYLGVNSGDMQKGVLRIEPNISLRPSGTQVLGTRVEIKNLNSLRALERSVDFEIRRQAELLRSGGQVAQETRGWDESQGITFVQRSKEEAQDYRYFPEPDLPPLVIPQEWIERVRAGLPELPLARLARFQEQYGFGHSEAGVIIAEPAVAGYFERAAAAAPGVSPRIIANWLVGEMFGLLNQFSLGMESNPVSPQRLAELVEMVADGEINQPTGKAVLAEMFSGGRTARQLVRDLGLAQVSDPELITRLVRQVLDENRGQVAAYRAGKKAIAGWLFGQVMRRAEGLANPQIVQTELDRALSETNQA